MSTLKTVAAASTTALAATLTLTASAPAHAAHGDIAEPAALAAKATDGALDRIRQLTNSPETMELAFYKKPFEKITHSPRRISPELLKKLSRGMVLHEKPKPGFKKFHGPDTFKNINTLRLQRQRMVGQ